MEFKNLSLIDQQNLLEHLDNFEYDYADTGFGQVNEGIGSVVGQAFGSFIGQGDSGKAMGAQTSGKIGDFISGIFGGHKEDKSLTGLNKFMSTFQGLPFYPTKDEMLQAAQLGKWESVEPAAIQASYNPQTGQWVRGDWHFQVIGTSPITVKDFKGANETHTFSAPMNAKGNGQLAPNVAQAAMGAVSNLFGGINPSQQSQPQLQQTQNMQTPMIAGNAMTTNNQPGQNAPASYGGQPALNTNTGAASVGQFSSMLSGNNMAYLILGGLLVVALIIWMANK